MILQGSTYSDFANIFNLFNGVRDMIFERSVRLHRITKEIGRLKVPADREAVIYNRETDRDLLKREKEKDLPF